MKISSMSIILLHLVFVFLINHEVQSQNRQGAGFNYISPLPGSKYIMPQNNIALRHGDPILIESLNGFSFVVSGSESGRISGEMVLSDDVKTVVFLPDTPFKLGETIHVKVNGNLKTQSGMDLETVEFDFTVTPIIPELPENYVLDQELGLSSKSFIQNAGSSNFKRVNDNNLPEDFPELTVDISNNPVEGEYYFATPFGYWGWFPDNVPYLIIFDNTCVPVYYKKLNTPAYDFRKLVDGTLSYYNNTWPTPTFEIMDSSFETIENYTIQDGYRTDFHEFFKLENGHVFITAYDPQIVGMDTVVAGGDPNAIVSGWIIQELDLNKNVVFQWRSWDHYQLTDADDHVDLTAAVIDVFHGNAIAVYSEDALILSPRNNNEITKIDWNTGEIIWRFGGKNNMFQFTNDTLRFSRAHNCRRLSNGNISLFDNGTYHPEPFFSSALEYELDEDNLIATLVSRLRSEPDIAGVIMGNVQTKENGNRVTGWGSGVPAITEFDADGEVAMEIYFSGINYRAYRLPWESNYFSVDKDTLEFGNVYFESSSTKNVSLANNAGHDIYVTSVYNKNTAFSCTDEFPLLIPEGETSSLAIKFSPDTVGQYADMITINSDINEDTLVQRIAHQVFVTAVASPNQGIDELAGLNVRMFPLPVSDILTIQLKENHSEIKLNLFNVSGENLHSATFINNGTYQLDMGSFITGLYFIQLEDTQSGKSGYYKIIKD